MKKAVKKEMSPEDQICWDIYNNEAGLTTKEKYLAKNCCKPQFKYLLNKAKEFWIQNGGVLSVKNKIEQGETCVNYYDFSDLRNAMIYYVQNNPDEIKRMDRESSKRYRLRQKNKIALENISKGMSQFVYRGRVAWTSTLTPSKYCVGLAESGYYPTVQNNKIVWQWAPVKH